MENEQKRDDEQTTATPNDEQQNEQSDGQSNEPAEQTAVEVAKRIFEKYRKAFEELAK